MGKAARTGVLLFILAIALHTGLAEPITLEKETYMLGDNVIIRLDAGIEQFSISTATETYRFMGEPGRSVMFSPREIGTYTIRAASSGKNHEKTFTVVPAPQENIDGNIIVMDNHGQHVAATLHVFDEVVGQANPSSIVSGNGHAAALSLPNSPIKEVRFTNLDFQGRIVIAQAPRKSFGRGALRAYSIDPSGLNFTNASIMSTAIGHELWKCNEWDFSSQQCNGEWERFMKITPGENYSFMLTQEGSGYAETGVATVNSDKPVYLPGEIATLSMAVLDTRGRLVESANVDLTVIDPNNFSYTYSTEEDIIEIEKGVYQVTFRNTHSEGTYDLFVRATGPDVNSNLTNSFEVRRNYAFDILRDTPMTIDPWLGPFESSITIISRSHTGPFSLTEIVPQDFTIRAPGASISEQNGSTLLTWVGLDNNSQVGYLAQAPLITPNLYSIESYIDYDGIIFREARPWYVAIDPVIFYDPAGNVSQQWNEGTGTGEDQIDDGTYFPNDADTTDYIASTANDPEVSEFSFPAVTQAGITRISLWVNTGTGTNAQYTYELQQGGNAVCTTTIQPSHSRNWTRCTWDSVSGDLSSLTAQFNAPVRNGGGKLQSAFVYAAYLEVQYDNPPIVILESPADGAVIEGTAEFNFTPTDDVDTILANCSLYGNFTGAWQIDATITNVPNGSETNITRNIDDASYLWNVICYDQNDNGAFASANQTLRVNAQPPSIRNQTLNATLINQSDSVLLEVNITDAWGVDTALAELEFPNGSRKNHTLTQSGDIWSTTFADTTQTGTYTITSISANDSLSQPARNNTPGISFEVAVSPPAEFDLTDPANATISSDLTPTLGWETTIEEDFDNYTILLDKDPSFQNPDFTYYARNSASNNTLTVGFALDANSAYYWRVIAYDTFGNTRNSTNDFQYVTDTIGPLVTLNLPQDNTYATSTTIVFNVTVSDANTIDSCTLSHNASGAWQGSTVNSTPSNGQPTYLEGLLTEGHIVWSVSCQDIAGNPTANTNNRTVIIDLTGPSVSLLGPSNNTLESQTNTLTFNASATDNLASIDSCTLIINGGIEQTNSSIAEGSAFSFQEFLQNGEYDWSVTCIDSNGLQSSSDSYNLSVSVIDSEAPLVTLASPSPDAYIPSGDVNFTYTPEDATGLVNCSLYLDGELNQTTSSPLTFETNTFAISAISNGEHEWNVSCFDNSTEENLGWSEMRTFTIDTVPPEAFSLASPANESIFKKSSITLAWESSSDANLVNYTVQADNDAEFATPEFTGAGTANTTTTSPLMDGMYFWRVIAYDLAGNNHTSETWTFNIHTHPPLLENATLNPQSPVTYSPNQLYRFNVTADEPLIDTIAIETNVTGSFTNNSPNSNFSLGDHTHIFSFTISDLAAGLYRYRWHINDTTGQENTTQQFLFAVTKAQPNIILTINSTQGNSTIDEDQYVNLTATLLSPPGGYIELHVDGQPIDTGDDTLQNISLFAEPGTYNITAIYNETQNYTQGSETHYLSVLDTTGPSISLIGPDNNSIEGSFTITFEYDVQDESTLANCSLFINQTLNQTDHTPVIGSNLFDTTLEEGDYEWSVSCLDTAGNEETSSTFVFSMRETSAMIVNVTSKEQQYERGDTALITIKATDEFGNNLDSNVTTDIVLGNSSTPWWDSAWKRRRPIILNWSLPSNLTDGLIEANITGFAGNIQSCQEIRIVANDSVQTRSIPYTLHDGDDSSWCYVGFMGNLSASGTDAIYFHAYYNNSAAPPHQAADTNTTLIFNAQAAAADEGTPTGVANIIGRSDATSATISLSGGGGSSQSAHGQGLINRTLGEVIQDVSVRYRYQAPTVTTGTWQLRYSTNDGNAYTDAFTGATPQTKSTSEWADITGSYSNLNWTELNRTRLQGRVSKPGGSGTVTLDLFWVEMRVVVRTPANITQSAVGEEERWVERNMSQTAPDGELSLTWETGGQEYGTYSAISETSSAGFENGTQSSQFSIVPDITAPGVKLHLPIDSEEAGVGSFSFTYEPTDINLDNCTLYFGEGGSWEANKTAQDPASGQNNTFQDIPFSIGVYDWNVLCYDTEGNNAFAPANFTLNITGPDLFVEDIWFNTLELIEGENVTIFANISNQGLSDANESFIVRVYNMSGQIEEDRTVGELSPGQRSTINVSYILEAGMNNITIWADAADTINESDERNNNRSKEVIVSLYQTYYGNVSAGVQLDAAEQSFYIFDNKTQRSGNVYVADSDSAFSFPSLQALTRATDASPTGNDLSDADAALTTGDFNDSISQEWGGGTDVPLQVASFDVGGAIVNNVPYVNSTNTSSFITGILWDTADDASNNGQFDDTDREDLVFVTTINQTKSGKYGTYDYEIRVPRALKEYKGTQDTVTFYYEIE